MRRRVTVSDTLPSSAIFLVDVRAALVPVVLITVQLLVFRAEPLAGQMWAAGIGTGFLWFVWHTDCLLSSGNKKAHQFFTDEPCISFTHFFTIA